MAQIKVGVDKMSVPTEIQFARQVVLDMTSNPNFASPAPALAAITSAATALETAYNTAQTARQNAKTQTSIAQAKKAALDLLLMQEASYIQNVTAGDKAKIESSGFSVRNPATPIGNLPAPTDVELAPSRNSGTVDMKWRGVRGADSYIVERALDSSGKLLWGTALTTTKSKATVNSMVSGSKYWFRVAGIGAAGQGAWSDAIAKIAP
jgi:hypothetical protein